MKLEIADYPVKQIRLSHRFSYENQVLEIDESEIVALVREDGRIEVRSGVGLTSPGRNAAQGGFGHREAPPFCDQSRNHCLP